MTTAVLLVLLLYYGTFAIYYKALFPAQNKHWIIALLLTLAAVAAGYVALEWLNLSMLNMPVAAVTMMAGLRFVTGMNRLQAAYVGSVSVLSACCFCGMFISLGALVLRRPIALDTTYYVFGMIGLFVGFFVCVFICKTIFADQKLKRLLYNESQLKLVVAYVIVATAGLTIMKSGRFVSQHDVWYPAIAFANFALSFGVLIFVIYHSIRGTELLVYRERSQMLEDQYARQLGHYKSYQKYTESFRTIWHDYKAMMRTVKSLIRVGEDEKAIQIIDAAYDDAQKRVRVHKQYSDNAVLDVMLQDLANLCDENEIQFFFQVFAPSNTGMSLLDAIRIFSNVTTNAVEACKKLPAAERYIHIVSSTEQQWAVLEVTNPYNGEILLRNGRPVTTKAETEIHGLGLGIVSEIVEALGGFVLYDSGAEGKTFSIRIFLPQTGSRAPLSP